MSDPDADLTIAEIRRLLAAARRLNQSSPAPPADPAPDAEPISWERIARVLAPTTWAWPGWLPHGFLTVLAGEPGTGKSLLCLHLVATCLERRPWPDGAPFAGPGGKTIWCESESSHALNLERARRWGLDLAGLLSPLRTPLANFKLDNSRHITALIALARREEVALVVLDSLRGLQSGGRRQVPLRLLLEALADIARETKKPFLLTHHLRKRSALDRDRPDLDRLLGTSAIAQTARVVWALDTPDPAAPGHRRLSVIKNNLAPLPAPLGFRVRDAGLHFGPPPEPPAKESELERARKFLRARLAAGPLPFREIQAAYQAAGLSERTVRRAKSRLAIHSYHPPGESQWYWTLPPAGDP